MFFMTMLSLLCSAQPAAPHAQQLAPAAAAERANSAAPLATGVVATDTAPAAATSDGTPAAAAAAAAAGPAATSAPVDIPGRTGAASPAAAAAGSGTPGSGEGLMQNLGSVMTVWGRNLLGANVVDSLSSNEGFKLFMGGEPSNCCCCKYCKTLTTVIVPLC
jgi:hypothetical protein